MSGRELAGEPEIGQPLSLAAARQLAASIHRKRAMNVDVIGDHKAAKHRRRAISTDREASTFAALAKKYVGEHARTELRSWKETSRLLGFDPNADFAFTSGGLAERWADRAIGAIDADAVWQVIEEARHGIPGIPVRHQRPSEARALALFAALSAFFSWALERRKVSVNPCANLKRPKAGQSRDRVLTAEEIRRLWDATDAENQAFAGILKLLMLTGCRLNEVARLEWDEVAEDLSQINLPAARVKNKRSFTVPLAPQAREILAALPRFECSYVFTHDGAAPVSGWSRLKRRLDSAMGVSDWVLHDVRRTAASGMQRLGIRTEVIERCLNHSSGSFRGVAGVYQRDPLTDEVRSALERWASHVEMLVTGTPAAKVVPITGGARR
jgi:integrase